MNKARRTKQSRNSGLNPADRPAKRFNERPLGSALLSEEAWRAVAETVGLTRRETLIVRYVFDNQKERAIAHLLAISEHTVHTHMNRIFRKLRVTTRTELLLRMVQVLIQLILADGGSLPPICRLHKNGQCCAETPRNALHCANSAAAQVSAEQPTGDITNLCEDSAASQKVNPGKITHRVA